MTDDHKRTNWPISFDTAKMCEGCNQQETCQAYQEVGKGKIKIYMPGHDVEGRPIQCSNRGVEPNYHGAIFYPQHYKKILRGD